MTVLDRLAGAPISWGVCEVPGWGIELSPDRVLGEMRQLGLTATELGKPERYVMVAIEPTTPMLFAGSSDPTCYLELKSIGLPEDKTADLSNALSLEIEKQLGVSKDRVYIEFADAPRKMWGWNGGTF